MLKSVRPHGDYVNFVNDQLWHNLSQCQGARLNCILRCHFWLCPTKGTVDRELYLFIHKLSQVPKYCKANQMRFTHKRLTKTRKQKPISFDRLSKPSNLNSISYLLRHLVLRAPTICFRLPTIALGAFRMLDCKLPPLTPGLIFGLHHIWAKLATY